MKPFIVIALMLGAGASLLTPFSGKLARFSRPGQTVKGPGETIPQAFRALISLAALTMLVLLTSVASSIMAIAMGWRSGQWISAAPLVASVTVMSLLRLLTRK